MSRSERLTKQDRQQRLLNEVRTSASIRVSGLARELGVAGETIRRDLAELSELGLVNRTYGGATISLTTTEPMVAERGLHLVEERIRIGRAATDIVQDGQVVMIDGGSTTHEVARQFSNLRRNLTIVTNSIGVASVSGANPTFRVVLCPGLYDHGEGSVLGESTVEFVHRYNADIAIIGSTGATLSGPCDASTGAAAVKLAMIRQSTNAMLVVDSSKFGRRSFQHICTWEEIRHVVTDTAPPPIFQLQLAESRIELHIAPEFEQ